MLISTLLFSILMLLDQLTKYFVDKFMTLGQTVTIIPNFINAKKVYNTGAAWGMGGETMTPVFTVISFIAGIVLGYYVIKNNWKTEKLKSIGLTLAFAGCWGNFYDRLCACFKWPGRQAVVDMVDFVPLDWIAKLFHQESFPIWNLADGYLVVGLILFSIDLIFFSERRAKSGKVRSNTK